MACSTCGLPTILGMPSSASEVNHTSITGPKALPTPPVPKRWTANSPASTTREIGTTASWYCGA